MGNDIDAHTPFNVVRRQGIIGFEKAKRVIHAFVALLCLTEITVSGELTNRTFSDPHDNWFDGKWGRAYHSDDDKSDQGKFYRAPHESPFVTGFRKFITHERQYDGKSQSMGNQRKLRGFSSIPFGKAFTVCGGK
ncbi:hypothetical protein GTN27_06710 [Ochrobactrum sp. EEELCW01]|jgi:hypothetical protein|nr:hypothetical protein [Ochrobactrum sp. P20RRXII]QTN02873.1 hypothetical protein GTN27_06710 [Ochrobactrum sp. EEELCW01]